MTEYLIFEDATEYWERLSWIAQVATAVIALAGVFFAGIQLRAVRLVSQATLLLELDSRFDSQELRDARNLFATMREDITKIVSGKHPLSSDDAKRTLCAEQWREILGKMRTEDEERYLKLIGWCGFFETVGMMVKKRYIAKKDVLDLFKGPLVDLDQAFRLHIEERSNETGVPKGLFEHALNLSKAAKAAN